MALALSIPLAFWLFQESKPPAQVPQPPPCSVTMTGGNPVFTCTGVDSAMASGLLQILNRIAAARLDVPAVLAKLDEVLPGPDALRTAAAQRRLTPGQRDVLVRKLSGFRGSMASVMCPQGDPEAGAYAEQFTEVLRQAGWSGLTSSRPEFVTFGVPVTGVVVMVSTTDVSGRQVPLQANAILRILRQAGITAKGARDAKIKAGEIRIVVGSRHAP